MELQEILNLINQRKFEESKKNLIELLRKKKNPNSILSSQENNYKNIYFILSQVCNQLNELENSKNYLLKHLKINPKDTEGFLILGNLYLRIREIKKAEKIYKKIIKIDNNNIKALINLAYLYEGVGDINKAIKYYKIARNLDPNNLSFFYSLSRLRDEYLDDNKINFVKKLLKDNKVSDKDKFLANFILSKNSEKKKDLINEIKFLNLSHEYFLKYNVNVKSKEYWLKIIPYHYDSFIYDKNNKDLIKNIKPIFIVGLPRSGSTITELILSTSETPKYNLGESNIINKILISSYGEKFFKSNKKERINLDLKYIKEKIICYLKNFNISDSNNKLILIDKSLENFFYIDLIIKIFPKAKFVITERNVSNNILGIYKKILLNIPWGHSFSDILLYIHNYKQIISFFKKKYKDNLYVVKTEDLQNIDDVKVKSLFNFCGLKFNKRYYDFKKNYQFVNNASNVQIRGNLKVDDEKKYEKYYELLDKYKSEYTWLKE